MSTSTGALLIHGLGGTQYDLGSLHKILRRAGVETHTLNLPGHGTTPEDLLSVHAEDWLNAVTAKYREVAARHDTLHVVGMCLGALLAVELCKREQHGKGKLISLAAPVFIDGWSTPWYRGLRKLVYRIPGLAARMRVEEEEPYGIKNELVRSIVKAKFERGENFHYRWVPLSCIREVDKLRGWVLKGLETMACPSLIIHAHEDELTTVRSAHALNDAIPDSQLVLLHNSYHMVCVDNERDRVAANVLQFIGLSPALAAQPARAGAMSAQEVEHIISTYRNSLLSGEFETLFPLFSHDVVWHEEGDNPLSGVYQGRSGLIDLFSRMMDYSRSTFTVRSVGQPDISGRSISIPLQFQVQTGSTRHGGCLTHVLRLRRNQIAKVTSSSTEQANQDALWHRLAANGAWTLEADAIDCSARAIPIERLPGEFEVAVTTLTAAPQAPSAAVAIRLRALEQQARHGDAPTAPPAAAPPWAQIHHAAWRQLEGLAQDRAQRRYIALIRKLVDLP